MINDCACKAVERQSAPQWSCGAVDTPVGKVLKVLSSWSKADYTGMIKSRISAFRMRYKVAPGLYAVGEPDENSDVFASANYKLSFDILRRELGGLNAWVLVLDTHGINVWCAAGKGTFGTAELVKRINETRLDGIVKHRRLILPQLGAPGIRAHEVRRLCGFRVHFGPVHARDIKGYVGAGYKATKEMRSVSFTMAERLVLTPMEIVPVMKKYPLYALAVLLIFGLNHQGVLFRDAFQGGRPFLVLGLGSVFSGAFLTPALLPFVPFRSFALKGLVVGAVVSASFIYLLDIENALLAASSYLLFPLLSSYIALQFTGSTTFTGMSGVKRELKIAIPVYFMALALCIVLIAIYKVQNWRIT